MQIVQPYAKIIDIPSYEAGIEKLRCIENYARVSHRSEDKQTEDSWRRFITFVVLEKGDWSVTEHEKATVEILCDRGITHEIVRHRLASYTQESTRFCNYGKKDGQITVIYPFDDSKIGQDIQEERVLKTQKDCWHTAMDCAEQAYLTMLELGVSPQIARSVLPNSLASKIICTMNLRTWRHIFMMRTTQEAHPQMKQIMIPLLKDFRERVPLLYDDIEPNQKQSISLARVK